MSLVHPAVAVRRLVARRPIIYWFAVLAIAAVVSLSIQREVAQLREVRSRWRTTATVLVARDDAAPGDTIEVDAVEVPAALAPPSAVGLDALGERPVRRRIDAGDIVTELDLAPRSGALALVPVTWRAVPVVESPRSDAAVGDRVDVVSDGVVIAADALVVGGHDAVTLVAVPADVAPLLPLAASASSVTLLRVP